MQLDGTQIILAIIAIITVLIGLISTILVGIGTVGFFILKYFIQEIKDIRDLWRQDQVTWAGLMSAYAEPLKDIVRLTGEHSETLKSVLDMLETQESNLKGNMKILASFAARNRKQQGGQ